ncbi:prepilin-type N-terminal cleavage/methylation domain-containing protein [Pseudoxanthomonas broegbernensis]|nr:type II secretion system protein [Pseudoxanthomonas broegbernensis]MBB6065726.1 prepilin-type N-terminal cleavage/methylation domain-containing protein [Pseudoxanthomonas broegbernensis]
MRRRCPPAMHAGFTLVEVAVVAGILGLLALTMTSAFEGMEQARQQNTAQAHAEAARQALRTFMLRNKRLPCPDNSTYGDRGREANGAGSCPGDLRVGWLPYESLGLQVPVRSQRLRYGVHRGTNADLVAPLHGAVDGPDLEGTGGLARALATAAQAAPSTDQPHYSGAVPALSSDTCASAEPVNPAFVLAAPATDRDVDGAIHPGFDGPNRGFATSSPCVAPPARPATRIYDDVVVAESATTLLGWLSTATR